MQAIYVDVNNLYSYNLNEIQVILFTTGTEGKPKAAELSFGSIFESSSQWKKITNFSFIFLIVIFGLKSLIWLIFMLSNPQGLISLNGQSSTIQTRVLNNNCFVKILVKCDETDSRYDEERPYRRHEGATTAIHPTTRRAGPVQNRDQRWHPAFRQGEGVRRFENPEFGANLCFFLV